MTKVDSMSMLMVVMSIDGVDTAWYRMDLGKWREERRRGDVGRFPTTLVDKPQPQTSASGDIIVQMLDAAFP